MPRPQRDSYGSVPRMKKTTSGSSGSKSTPREGRTPRRVSGPSLSPPPNLHRSKSPSRGSKTQLSASVTSIPMPEPDPPECTSEVIYGYFAELAFQAEEDNLRRLEAAEAVAAGDVTFTLTRETDTPLSSVGSLASR